MIEYVDSQHSISVCFLLLSPEQTRLLQVDCQASKAVFKANNAHEAVGVWNGADRRDDIASRDCISSATKIAGNHPES